MQNSEFEWDDGKAELNRRDHRVTFEMAREVFNDAFAIERVDDRQDEAEKRYVILGMVDERLLYVVYTEREERIRLISARLAEPRERREYHNENST